MTMKLLIACCIVPLSLVAQSMGVGFTKLTPPVNNGAWVNQGTATLSTANGYLTLTAPAVSSYQMRLYEWDRSTNTSATALLQWAVPERSARNHSSLVVLRDSASGKMFSCGRHAPGDSTPFHQIVAILWDSATALAGPPIVQPVVFSTSNSLPPAGSFVVRATYDGTNLICSYAVTPSGPFQPYYSRLIADWTMGVPDKAGVAVTAASTGGATNVSRFMHFKLE